MCLISGSFPVFTKKQPKLCNERTVVMKPPAVWMPKDKGVTSMSLNSCPLLSF